MAAEVTGLPDRTGTPKLPLISDGRSLVSPTQNSRPPSVREQASVWAQDIRERLAKKISEDEDIDDNEIQVLKHEFIAQVIPALQKDDRKSWIYLREAMELLVPFKDLLGAQQDMYHYVERIHHHIDVHKERLFDLHVIESLAKVFPKEVKAIKITGVKPLKTYCPPTPPRSLAPQSPRRPSPIKPKPLPDGNNPFKLERPGDGMKDNYRPKAMTFGDLRKSMPNVVLEMATREAIWSACLGTTAQAMNTDLLEEEDEEDEIDDGARSPESARSGDSGYQPDAADFIEELSDAGAENEIPENLPKVVNGRDAVEYFTTCYHTGKIKFMFFNIAPNRVYRPYDLVACAKNKANPEHYVFSTFGVLHVYPKQPAESISLAEWQKEAVLFNACSVLPFFKHYLIKKMFNRWRQNIHFAEFAHIRHNTAEDMIQSVPSYGAALLQVARLCQELLILKMLPYNTDKTYQLIEFENVINYMNMQADKVLERFFRYNKVVVDTTAEESFKKLKHCEEQMKHKTVFSKDSLHLQKKKKEQRERNLARARHETSRLPNFVTLVDQMILSHLVQLSRTCITIFVHSTMSIGEEAPREGLFKAFLVFGQKDSLTLNPAKEKFLKVISRTFMFIPEKLCEAAVPIDGTLQVKLPDEEFLTEAREYHASPVPTVKTSTSVHTSIVSAMKDPKKTRPDRRRSTAALTALTATTSQSFRTGNTTSPYGTQEGDRSPRPFSMATQSIVHTPDLPGPDIPSKERDSMGQATPAAILPNQAEEDMVIAGQGFMGQYRPLSKINLQEKLDNDEAYMKAMKVHEHLMREAIEEIDEYCEKNAWLNEIQAFAKSWNEESLSQFEGASGFSIEQKLSEIRQWSDRVRNFDKTYTTDNGIFFIDCCGIQDTLLPKLKGIYEEICSHVAEEGAALAKKYCNEMNTVLKNMSTKDTSIGGFAIYAKNVSNYKKDTLVYQQKMEYIKSLYEVIRMSYRQLNPDEEKLEENVMACWDAFLFQIQDAMEFVNIQTPIIQQNLDDTFQQAGYTEKEKKAQAADASRDANMFMEDGEEGGKKSKKMVPIILAEPAENYSDSNLPKLEEEAQKLCEIATTGKFLDPKQKPTRILIEMGKLREQFYDIQKQMQQASKWKEAITGEPYDLKILNQMAGQMDIRQELWKYVEVSTHSILEWKSILFKKLHCRKAVDKLIEWQAAAGQIKHHLPPGDEVLASWYRMLSDFKQPLPLLHKLSNDALKPRHWKAIFLGMGEQYDPNHQFTVEELLAYNLGNHSQTINNIYLAAVAEFSIEQKLVKIRKLWEDREFKLAKHIPDSVFKRDDGRLGTRGGTTSARKRRMEKFRKDTTSSAAQKTLDLNVDSLYTIIEVEDLKYLLEDSRVMVKAMLSSPYVADHKAEAEYWSQSLAEVEEIVDLWLTCQKKWLYLLKVFEEPEHLKKLERQAVMFESVHNSLTEVMSAVAADPKILAMLTRQRGEKGYRALQGERLREILIKLIAEEESIMTALDAVFDQARAGFPRFYFLSNQELVELLGISRNPRLWKPFVRKCFSGVADVTFDLPSGSTSMNSALDYALNAHKLEVTKLEGLLGEVLPLHCRVEAGSMATKWFSTLENTMKTTMQLVMEACVQARLEDGSKQPIQLLEELAKYENLANQPEAEELASDIKHQFSHWILKFPTQCVLTAEAIMWERNVFRALEKTDRKELDSQRTNLTSRIEQYISVLQENASAYMHSNMRTRLHNLLGCLVSQALYHRDVIEKLLSSKNLSDGAYDWLKVLKYHMEIRSVLRAKTEPPEPDASKPTTAMTKASGPPDDFDLQRAKTTVSTGYQFGACLVSQMGSMFSYDLEYMGPTPRLVFTPLTERAHLSLTMALKSFQCGALIGGAAAGKSDTIRDLAKALGRHLVTVNCGDELTLPMMNQYLTGMIHSGSWGLFDDTDRMTMGLMSVFAQHLDYLSNALRVLDASSDNQYGIRGQPRFDKKAAPKHGEKKIRRNSLTTLHSLPQSDPEILPPPLPIERQATVPHGFNEEGLILGHPVKGDTAEEGLITYFEDPWVKERERRHSIEKEIEIKESELYKSMRPPPLFYEHVTQRRKPKPDYKDLANAQRTYKPTYIGNVLFNGKLVRANANFGCFMTMNTTNPSAHIPDNLRLCMRPCALVLPDTKTIIEVQLFCNGIKQYKAIASKVGVFFDLMNTQLPRKKQYDFSLRTVTTVIKSACTRLHREYHHLVQLEQKKQDKRAATSKSSEGDAENESASDGRSSTAGSVSVHSLGDMLQIEEAAIINSLLLILTPKMETAEDLAKFRTILRDVFPSSSRPGSDTPRHNPILMNGIKENLLQDNLQATDGLMEKVMQLYYALKLKQGIMLIGPTGCGKTTIWSTLSKTLNLLHAKDSEPAYDDELVPERGMAMQFTQKLKILKEQERPDSGKAGGLWKKVRGVAAVTNFSTYVIDQVFEEDEIFPKVDCDVVFPNSMEAKKLFGYYNDKLWQQGMLQLMFGNSHFQVESAKYASENWDEKKNKAGIEHPSIINKWIVMDGAINPNWIDSMSTVLDSSKKLSLPNGEQIAIQDSTSILFELTDLTNSSPAAISRCAIVSCDAETVHWKSLIESWSVGAKQRWVINPMSIQILNILVSNVFPAALRFLEKECCVSLLHGTGRHTKSSSGAATGIQEVTSFLRIFSALLETSFLRDNWEKKEGIGMGDGSSAGDSRPGTTATGGPPESRKSGRASSMAKMEEMIPGYMAIIKHMFAFSFIWGFGGNLHNNFVSKFDEFVRETLSKASQPVLVPDGGTVFDYCVDIKQGCFTRWCDRQAEKARNVPASYIVIPEIEKYTYIIDLLLGNNNPVLLCGDPGVGKSSLIHNMVQSKHLYSKMFMSANLLPEDFQRRIFPYLTDSKSNEPAMRPGTTSKPSDKHLFLIEDLNVAGTDGVTGSQPTLELMRQMMSKKFLYDLDRKTPIVAERVSFLATSTNPGAIGSGLGQTLNPMSSRVTRQFFVLNFFSHTEEVLHSIYTRSVQSWLEEFPTYTVEHHVEFAKAIVQGVIDMYESVREKLRPTPANAHYIFTLHDIARVMEGILLMSPRSKARKAKGKKKETIKKKGNQPPVELLKARSSSLLSKKGDEDAFPPMMKVIARLWCHEVTRVFGDRIISDDDCQWFENSIEEVVDKNFCSGSSDWHDKMSVILEDNMSQRDGTPLGDLVHTPMPPAREISTTTQESQDEQLALADKPVPGLDLPSTTPEFDQLRQMMSTRTSTMVTEEREGTPPLLERGVTEAELDEAAAVKLSQQQPEEEEKQQSSGSKGTPAQAESSTDKSADKASTGGDASTAEKSHSKSDGAKSVASKSSKASGTASTKTGEDGSTDQGEGGKTSRSTKSSGTTKTTGSKADTDRSEKQDKKSTTDTDKSTAAGSDESSDDSEETESDSGEETMDTESQTTQASKRAESRDGGSRLGSRQVSFMTDTRATTDGESPSLLLGTGYSSEVSDLNLYDPTKTPSRISDIDKSRSSSRLSGKTPTTPGIIAGRKAAGGSRGAQGAKRGVTFKQGLIADRDFEHYVGPLMAMDQIKESGEKLTSFLFSKYILPMHAEAYGIPVEKGYSEVTETQLTEALGTCHTGYVQKTLQRVDLVFFKEAVHHTARLSRVLATPQGHAVLLGVSYCTGRSTLVKLAAHVANCRMFEPKMQFEKDNKLAIVHEHLKKSSRLAAMHGKSIVLLLKEDMGEEAIRDVCGFIKEGTCNGLYTEEDIQNICTQMTPGGVKTTRVDKIEAAYNKYISRVKQNLHVVFSFNYNNSVAGGRQKNLYSKLTQFPALVTLCCHVDVYRPWTHDAYVAVAKHWLTVPSKIIVPWNEQARQEHVSLVSSAMAYIHQSSIAAVEKLYSHQRHHYKFFTPLTFMELAHIFKVVSAFTKREEAAKIEKHEAALTKINEAFSSIASYKREVSDLVPKHRAANEEVKEHVEHVELQREEYIKALDRCKIEEDRIDRMMSPLENLRKDAQAEFDRVNPTYETALTALKALNTNDVQEIKSYRVPPAGVVLVMDSICLLFREEMSWESAKSLMMRENFFHDLEFYDKDNVPDDIFADLGKYYRRAEFVPEYIGCSSMAAAALCSWVRAVYKYAEICRNMKPKIQQLLEAEEQLNQAQAILGEKRVAANRIKSDLEHRIHAHKEAVKKAKLIEKNIQAVEKKTAKAQNLMDNMSPQHTLWKSELKKSKSKVKTAPADALIAAACVCYHGPLDNRTRAELMSDWLSRCELGNFDPALRPGRQVKQISLSAKLDSLMKGAHAMPEPPVDGAGFPQTEDVLSLHGDTERASSASSAPHVISNYKHNPSIYDASSAFRAEVRLDNVGDGTESTEANSTSSKNLLATRDNFELQDVLSTFEELSDWKLKDLPADVYSVHNALIMRVCAQNRKHCWPLLVDVDDQAETWVRTLQESACIIRDIESGDFEFERMTAMGGEYEGDARSLLQSRGTEKTFTSEFQSEFESEFLSMVGSTIGDSESRPTTTRTTRQGFGAESRLTDDFRAMTSVMHPLTRIESVIEDHIDKPEDNLWVIAADDPDLNYRLVNAIIHGVTILITNLERRALDPLFRGLLTKQFNINKDGQRVIRIGDLEFKYHDDFKLYLSTSMPIFLKGEGIYDLPIQKLSVIDLATSQEGIVDLLLFEIMEIERPEYDGQKRSIEGDLIHHRHEINREHEVIMQKTQQMSTPLLDDKTLLESLIKCQGNVDRNQMILDETNYMQRHLEEKRVHYIPVANHGAKLYEIIQRVAVLSPYYFLSLKTFHRLYTETIRSRHRGKGSTGAPKARAQELINATVGVIYKYTASMMFESHTKLFGLLITLERLRMAQQLSNQELGLFVNGVDTSEIEDSIVFDDKPDWLTNKIWLDCAALETTLSRFRGLRESLINYTEDWQEYFQCPIDLMNLLPGDWMANLNPFEKVLLWRICAPHKMFDVSQALVLHEMGGVLQRAENYNIKQIYTNCDRSIPVVFMLPSGPDDSFPENQFTVEGIKGHTFSNPTREIMSFAKDSGMEGRVHVVTLGVNTQMHELQHAMEDCLLTGYWLVIQNAHLAEAWPEDTLTLIKTIVQSKGSGPDEEMSIPSYESTVHDEGQSTMTKISTLEDPVHKDFRLFVTTRIDNGRTIPGLLIQYGFKVTCELVHNFSDTVKRTYVNAEKVLNKRDRGSLSIRKIYGKTNHVIPMAVLHSILVHRQTFGLGAFARENYWSHVDLAAALEQFLVILSLCQRHRGIPEIFAQVYSGHCIDVQDRKIVESITESLLLPPGKLTLIPNTTPGVASILSSLLPRGQLESFENKLDGMVSVESSSLSLAPSVVGEFTQKQSRGLLDDLLRVVGAPDLISVPVDVSFRKAEALLQEIYHAVLDFPELPETNANGFYPLELFYHSEAEISRHLVERVRDDTLYLLRIAQGASPGDPRTLALLVAISQHRVPADWEERAFTTGVSISQWVALFRKRVTTLKEYVEDAEGPVSFNLAAFHRPDRFIHSVLQEFVRREFKDLHTCKLDVQFLPIDARPPTKPSRGAYLSGLRLHNAQWDSSKSALMEPLTPDKSTCKMPVIWLKPIDKYELERKRNDTKSHHYNCPIYTSASSSCLTWTNIVGTIELPSIRLPTIWAQKSVMVSCAVDEFLASDLAQTSA